MKKGISYPVAVSLLVFVISLNTCKIPFFFPVLFLGALFLDLVKYCNNNDEGILKKFLYSFSLIFCSEISKTYF